ncbi:MAG TPA: protease modulator HflC [Myxococcales bacterium]|nr:HflC protein [Myxococcales bacterium]HAN32230.1 protease modulator HflC [Myxococcales bacterium]|tara:strand:- start:66 stop:1049 length:984 start_codon:yes stop_codon:yes gene_type:complete
MKTFSNRAGVVVLLLFGFIVLLWNNCVLIVHEYEQVVVTEFGDPIGDARTDPGLYFIMPWYDTHVFPKRLLRWDGERAQIPTRDKRFIWVDSTARWQIDKPLKFLQAVRDTRGAQTRIDDIIDSKVREVISKHDLIEVVRSSRQLVGLPAGVSGTNSLKIGKGRGMLQQEIVENASLKVAEYGIRLVDVRIKRINYIEEVQRNIYNRMVAERKKVAEQYRSEGKGRAAEILGRMEKELKVIRSTAFRKAREIEGAADSEAARIYAESYSQDAEFYAFLETLATYDKALGSKRSSGTRASLVLDTDADFFRYLKHAGRKVGSKRKSSR